MEVKSKTVFLAVALLFAGLVIPTASAQQISGPVKAVQLTGLPGVKENTKGTLGVEKGHLDFAYAKGSSEVSASSIEDVVTGADSQIAVGNTIHMISMAAPYGPGRFLSLFRTKIDTLTVQYRDDDGGLHGAIFSMPAGAADVIKSELLTQGAHTTATEGLNAASAPSSSSAGKEHKQ